MKLYFAPGSCSLSPHIVLKELGLPFELVRVDFATKKTSDGTDFTTINPKGYVPTLQLDNGEILTEGPAIVQYLADQKPESGLAPSNGTLPRYHLQEWLNFVSTEIHKGFSPLFNPKLPDAAREIFIAKMKQRFGELDKVLARRDYLMGEKFSVADAYLFTLLGWSRNFGLDLGEWKHLADYRQRIAARPAVKAALESEREIKKAA